MTKWAYSGSRKSRAEGFLRKFEKAGKVVKRRGTFDRVKILSRKRKKQGFETPGVV